jgi:hypothetical protein
MFPSKREAERRGERRRRRRKRGEGREALASPRNRS